MEGLFEKLENSSRRTSPVRGLNTPVLTLTTQESSLRQVQIPTLHKTYSTRHEISDFLETLVKNAQSIAELSMAHNTYSEQVLCCLSRAIPKCQGLAAFELRSICLLYTSDAADE